MWITVLILAAVLAALLATPLGDRPLAALFPVGEVEAVDFADLSLSDKPNQFLICPEQMCRAERHAVSPVFEVPVERLAAYWRGVIATQPRLEVLARAPNGLHVDYVQRSARFRFPDLVTVRLIPLSPERSTLAVYSRALYGRKDFGVNRQRVEAWIDLLGRAGKSDGPGPGAARRPPPETS
jgi:uncharacterized protein (DUF1499 family)